MPTWTSADLDDPTAETYIVDEDVANTDHDDASAMVRGIEYGSPNLTTDLVGWWPLHDESGDTTDYSGEGNHGTVNGATRGVAGRGGLQAMSFDGTDDNVSTALTVDWSTSYTVSVWLNLANTDSENEYAVNTWGGTDPYKGWIIRYAGNNGLWKYDISSGSGVDATVTATPTADTWTHLVGKYDGSDIVLYKNNVEVSRTSASPQNVVTSVRIGERSSGGSNFEGLISDVRIYDRSLSSSEIQTLYEWGSGDYAEPADNDDGGVSYYSFNSSNALDQWGTNDGTVNGATYVSDGGPREDGAYSFDGADDYITGSPLLNESAGTVSLWINPDNSLGSAIEHFYGFREESGKLFSMQNYNNGNTYWGWNGSTDYRVIISDNYPTNTWLHATLTWDSNDNETILYWNGERRGSAGYSQLFTNDTYRGAIGARNKEGAIEEYFSGDIDDVRFYNRALDSWEIQEIYQYGTLGRDMRDMVVRA